MQPTTYSIATDMSNMAESFPVLHVKGSHYDVGHSTGSTFQSRIKTYFQKSDLFLNSLQPFYDSRDGRQVVESVLAITEKNFPMYVDEIRGTALGAGLPFETLFINNMLLEIYFGFSQNKPRLTREDLGCSTVYVNRPDLKVIGHNEDCEILVKYLGYFVDATVQSYDGSQEKFTSLCYPGGLPGVSMSHNKHGLVFSINTLVAPTVGVTTPVDFITRAMLKASNIDELRKIVGNVGYGVSSGCSINVGSVADTSSQWSVEVLPRVQESKVHIKTINESENPDEAVYFHMNEYRHSDIQVETAVRSRTRLERAQEHPVPTCARAVRSILGDTSNQCYPIYRSTRPTDGASTICTGMYDLLRKRLDVYFDNPSKDIDPLLSFQI